MSSISLPRILQTKKNSDDLEKEQYDKQLVNILCLIYIHFESIINLFWTLLIFFYTFNCALSIDRWYQAIHFLNLLEINNNGRAKLHLAFISLQ